MKHNFNDRQKNYIFDSNDCSILYAVAGSGKTSTLVSKALYLETELEDINKEILLLSFTKYSSINFEHKIKQYIDSDQTQIKFHTIDAFCRNCLLELDIELVDIAVGNLCQRFTQELMINGQYEKLFGGQKIIIFVDEAQDLNNQQLELLQIFYANNAGIHVIGDILQNIYGFRGSCCQILQDFESKINNNINNNIKNSRPFKTFTLDVNYRSKKSIIDIINIIAKNIIPNNYPIKMIHPGIVDNNDSQIYDLDMCITKNNSIRDITRNIIMNIKEWLNHTPIHQIAILYRQKSQQSLQEELIYDLESQLIQNNIKVRVLDQHNRNNYNNDHINIQTIHSAKGLEWDNVILLDCQYQCNGNYKKIVHIRSEKSYTDEEDRILYVLLSRARRRIIMPKIQNNFVYNRYLKCYIQFLDFKYQINYVENNKQYETVDQVIQYMPDDMMNSILYICCPKFQLTQHKIETNCPTEYHQNICDEGYFDIYLRMLDLLINKELRKNIIYVCIHKEIYNVSMKLHNFQKLINDSRENNCESIIMQKILENCSFDRSNHTLEQLIHMTVFIPMYFNNQESAFIDQKSKELNQILHQNNVQIDQLYQCLEELSGRKRLNPHILDIMRQQLCSDMKLNEFSTNYQQVYMKYSNKYIINVENCNDNGILLVKNRLSDQLEPRDIFELACQIHSYYSCDQKNMSKNLADYDCKIFNAVNGKVYDFKFDYQQLIQFINTLKYTFDSNQ